MSPLPQFEITYRASEPRLSHQQSIEPFLMILYDPINTYQNCHTVGSHMEWLSCAFIIAVDSDKYHRLSFHIPVTPREPTRLTTNAVEINRRE